MNSNVPAGAAMLLEFIGKAETGTTGPEAYDIIVFFKQAKLPKPLTEYTIDELLTAQRTWAKNWGGSAAGKYQIIRKTLAGLVAELGISGSAHFTPDLQDRLGFVLLTRRGWQAFTSGQISVGAFALSLAKEWASMPVLSNVQGAHRAVKRGESYYAGDGVNSSQKHAEDLEAILTAARAPAKPSQQPPAPTPAPEPRSNVRGIVGWAILILTALGGVLAAAWGWLVSLWDKVF